MLVDDSNDYRLWVNNILHQQYHLWVDGIYPKYTRFAQTISNPDARKQSNFSLGQELANWDVEGAFKVLQARWSMVSNSWHLLNTQDLSDIMYACVVMHNMILEDEKDEDLPVLLPLWQVAFFSTSSKRFHFIDLQ